MNKKQKINLLRIILAAALLLILSRLRINGIPRFCFYMIPYLIVGYDVLKKAVHGIVHRQPFDECLLMSVATIGAIAAAFAKSGDYTEAVAVMLFYQTGELFQSYAVGKSRKNITELMDISPEYANIYDENGGIVQVDPDDVECGSLIVVRAGEKIPIDGIIKKGSSSLDTSSLTGESLPRDVGAGDEVLSGCINTGAVLEIETTREYSDSTVSRVMELIEDASSRKSKSENFIAKFSRVYTPAVVFAAIALALLPPLVLTVMRIPFLWSTWIYRALIFLVISCPCALVVSIPLSFFAGIGFAGKKGVLVKGSNYLEALSEVKTVVFDKTGTLTKGVFEVVSVHPNDISADELIHIAAHAERYSNHPIALSLKKAFGNEADGCTVEDAEEIAGRGIKAVIEGRIVYAGNESLMKEAVSDGIIPECKSCHDHTGTIIHIAIDGVYAGHVLISDVIKPHSAEAVQALKKAGIRETVILTGDRKSTAEQVAAALKIDRVFSDLLPGDKVSKIEELINEKQREEDRIAFVGDGINDAPVLSRANVGIAMGALGSDAAIEAADIVLMDDDPLKIATAIAISKKTLRIVRQNICFAIGVKIICLILGSLGFANMWTAVFADVGVMVLAVLNAIRCML
ncbi:MAG: heavy metal translocating P-type ATPase [Lachnospiraceae bacterium]|nr:heavy metal translocating P-type ATPase [Lachnospiraceae bacterium]